MLPRDGCLQGGGEKVIMEHFSQGLEYLYGEKVNDVLPSKVGPNLLKSQILSRKKMKMEAFLASQSAWWLW